MIALYTSELYIRHAWWISINEKQGKAARLVLICEMLKSKSWFWEKYGIQWHDFGRNVEINDMVLERGRNGVNSVEQRRQWCREKAINLKERSAFTNTQRQQHVCIPHVCINLKEGSAFTNTQGQQHVWIPHVYPIYTSCIHHVHLMYTSYFSQTPQTVSELWGWTCFQNFS